MRKKIIAALLVVAVAASMLMGCGGESGTESEGSKTTGGEGGGAFIVPINSNSVTCMTPYNVYGSDDQLMAFAPCFDPLYIVTKEDTRWYLADSLKATAEDGCHYQLKLKEGLKWHDGEVITVDDVIFSVKAILEPSNAADPSNVSYNGKPIATSKVDDLTLDITLQEPFSAFESEFGRMQIFPEHVFGGDVKVKDNTEAVNKGIGSGPFKLKEFKEGDSIVYERFDDYYRGKASLDEVIVKVMTDESAQEAALQSGELSVMRVTNQTKLDKYSKDDNYTVYNIPEGRLNYMAFNYQSPAMKDIDARKAVCLALNGDDIITGAYGSEDLAVAAKNFCSPENLYYNDEMEGYKQNIEEAKKLAEKSGLTKQTIHYIYNQNRPNMKETAQVVQQQLKEIGVKVEIEGLDSPAFFPHLFAAWINGEPQEDTTWDLASNGMDQMNSDPATKMTSWQGELLEIGFYVSPETKELWRTASQSLTEEDKETNFKKLQEQVNEDYAMYPMANTNYAMVARKEFKGLDTIKRVPVFEDYLEITMEK